MYQYFDAYNIINIKILQNPIIHDKTKVLIDSLIIIKNN